MTRPNSLNEPAVRNYLVMCLAVLALILLVLARRDLGLWALFPVLLGAGGALLRWRAAPLMLLVLLAGLLAIFETLATASRYRPDETSRGASLEIWILSGAVLAYCVAHFRLQGLTVSIFPPESHAGESEPPAAGTDPPSSADQPRAARSVSPWEISWLIMALPIWAFLGQMAGRLLPTRMSALGLPPWMWQAILLVWLLGGGLLIGAGVLDYFGRQQMTRREARLWLQEVFWQETRRDLRRVSRWLAWARLRRAARHGRSNS
jgi:hypothetical protein